MDLKLGLFIDILSDMRAFVQNTFSISESSKVYDRIL